MFVNIWQIKFLNRALTRMKSENHPSQHSERAWKISFLYLKKKQKLVCQRTIHRFKFFEYSWLFCEIYNQDFKCQNLALKSIKKSKSQKMQIKTQPLLAVVVLVMLCLSVDCGPNICTDCFNGSSYYQCNGKSCQAFYWPYSYTPYNIQCLFSTYSCYWSKYIDQSKNYLFTACNYTMSYCVDCGKQDKCFKCKRGYGLDTNASCKDCSILVDRNCLQCDDRYTCTSCAYGYMRLTNYSTGSAITTCLSCPSAIPGCITCDGRSSCTSCQLDYIPISGLCYQKDGKTLANAIDYQYLLTNQTGAANDLQKNTNSLQQDMNDLLSKIFIALIIIAIFLFLGIATTCWTSRKSAKALEKRSLLSAHD